MTKATSLFAALPNPTRFLEVELRKFIDFVNSESELELEDEDEDEAEEEDEESYKESMFTRRRLTEHKRNEEGGDLLTV